MENNGRLTPLHRLDSAEQAASNIAAQFDEFREMKNGWLEGEGPAPSRSGMDRLESGFTQHFPSQTTPSRIDPAVDGNI